MTANDLVFSPCGPEEMELARPGLERAPPVRTARGRALIVSDTLAVAFIDAHPRARSRYGRLPEAAPPRLDATPRSEAQAAETGPRPSARVGAVSHRRRAARFHGGPRAARVCRHLHRAAPAVLATVASRHPERHRRCHRVRGDARVPDVSEGTVHGIRSGGRRGEGVVSQSA